MSLILAAALLTACALAALALPLFRRPPSRGEGNELALYRAQLAELERDLARGLVAVEEAAAARREIERRLLRAAARSAPTLATTRSGRLLLAASLALVPLLAVALYARLGSPHLPDQPLAARALPPQQGPDLREMVARLERRLEAEPNALDGWLLLARAKAALGDPLGGVAAARRALALAPDSVAAALALAELLIQTGGGTVSPEARALLERVRANDPREPRAAYYLGLAALQSGDRERALAIWETLLAEAPPDAPWRASVAEAIRAAAREAGIEAENMLARAAERARARRTEAGSGSPEGGVSERARAIAALPPEERAAAIRGMVEGLEARLEATGGDAEGWVRLGRARLVLGEPEKARAAFAKALALRPDDPAVLSDYAGTLLGPPDGAGLPAVGAEARAAYEKLALLVPHDPEPWWYLGIAALQAGRPEEARRHWRRVLALLPDSHPDRPAIEEKLRAIGG
ncbi:MAG: c-type cytochrome biogenesis protein CcmI [Geminicoccaceae bacterium]|nr:c-type cytochrome biogenesis protein CcmI [Geminicoccaceae bacterium]MDW8125674.1 c-type cytochrome biogenesis protein CcmI [Geminicoccaceae bacterium]MDW8340522.1 c-type cytochrome biogenesis protein CcmI [Geminicoccaceae bacterium]